jgi:sugar phosphate isomerase/epimerase
VNGDGNPAIGIAIATLLAAPFEATDAEAGAAGEAALAAGFTEAAVWARHLSAVASLGLRVSQVEAATRWPTASRDDAAAEAVRLAGLAAEHSAPFIGAACLAPQFPDPARARANLARVVEEGEAAGAKVCLEFVAGTAVPTLEAAWSLMAPLGPAATILIDTLWWVRQPDGPQLELLRTLPGDRIGFIQICDASANPGPDLLRDALTSRPLPGDGIVDFPPLLGALQEIGAAPTMVTEIFNSSLIETNGAHAAARMMREAAFAAVAASGY